jgi:hypothetical protein
VSCQFLLSTKRVGKVGAGVVGTGPKQPPPWVMPG